jgi:hypothetical protein
MSSKEFEEKFRKAVEETFKDVTNDMALKFRTEQDLKRMNKEHKLGNITTEELFDAEWYYYENWIMPITYDTHYGSVILN